MKNLKKHLGRFLVGTMVVGIVGATTVKIVEAEQTTPPIQLNGEKDAPTVDD